MVAQELVKGDFLCAPSTLLFCTEHSVEGAHEGQEAQNSILAVQRSAELRSVCTYRTVSASATMVMAGVIPIVLLAVKRQNIFRLALELERTEAATVAIREIMLGPHNRILSGFSPGCTRRGHG